MPDEEIIALYFGREQEAIVRTDEKYPPYCGSIAYAILHDAHRMGLHSAANAAGACDVDSDAVAHQPEESIRAFIDALPTRDGNIFLRRYFYVESVTDIAKRYSLWFSTYFYSKKPVHFAQAFCYTKNNRSSDSLAGR